MRYFSDCHSCLPVRPDVDINLLRLHYDSGVRYMSLNVGMDMQPLAQILRTIASFRRQIQHSDFLVQANSYADIENAIANDKLAVSFDLEGGIALLESTNMVWLYHELGVRQIHLAYNRNNSLAGGVHDVPQGLTPLGEKIVNAIHNAGILMDLSHSSEQTAMDICSLSSIEDKPVLYSHANPAAVVSHRRNISNNMMRMVAKTGGLVCLNGVGQFIGDASLNPLSMIPVIEYTASLIGYEHTAIGLDYSYNDGISDIPENTNIDHWWPAASGYGPNGLSGKYVSPSAFNIIAEELAKKNYTEEQIDAITRTNILNLIKRIWI